MSYYKIINGVRYTRDLLEAAEAFTQGRGESKISFEEIQAIYQIAHDGKRITDTERRTLRYITRTYPFTDKARDWINERLPSEELNPVEKTLRRVLREEYCFPNVQWNVSAEEVARHEAEDGDRLFEEVLRSAIDAFLYSSQGRLGFAGIAARMGSTEPLKKYLDTGTLYLVPRSEADKAALGVGMPVFGEQEDGNWVFILKVPAFYPTLFVAYVHQYLKSHYSLGYFALTEDINTLASGIIRDLNGYDGLQWEFDPTEIARQMTLRPEQSFGEGLFAAVYGAIYTAESSFSFHDFIAQEVWVDPEREWIDPDRALRNYMFDYINTGKIYLIPADYRAQTQAGTAAFPIPERFEFWLEGDWIFGLEMPQKTHVRFVMNVPRENNDGQTGWNDGFIEETLSFDARMQSVLTDEFGLSNVNLTYLQQEFEDQRDQYGPSWRNAPGLLRQAINTVLDDYLTPMSVFKNVELVHPEISPANFATPLAYRAAIREKTKTYLSGATMEFMSNFLTDNNPIHGETVQDNWLFFVNIPWVYDVGFWVVIPRRPDYGVLPYVYTLVL